MVKQLSKLISSLGGPTIFGSAKYKISGIECDSRKVKNGFLFIAVRGLTVDGHNFIEVAIENGAKAVVGEIEPKKDWLAKITYIKVSNSRKTLGLIASAWFDYPSSKMKIVGVTGTDGKTTTVNIIYWLLKNAGYSVGLVSTVSARIGNKEHDTGFHVTNPDPLPLQKFLAEMVKAGCQYAILEVTSHGLDQERVAGIKFDVGVLTNITHEHLDYHKTFKNYVLAKSKLFLNTKIAILNADDESFGLITKLIGGKTQVVSYSKKTLEGGLKKAVEEKFPEKYNRMNATAAICAVKHFGLSDKNLLQSIKSFPGVSGRNEEIKNFKGIKIIVDFAHTPNALENILASLKKQTNGKLIAVFGCAGERDAAKRPMMGAIGTKLADFSVFTAEDPRKEDINEIIKQVASGVKTYDVKEIETSNYDDTYHRSDKHYFFRIPERGEAIWYAINKLAQKGDTVVICGKGHEKSMCYNGIEYPWSDQEAVKLALKGRVKKIIRG